MGTSGDKIVLLDGMGSGSGSATNGLLSMIPGMFANLIGGNKMDPNLVAALMNGRNNQDGFGGANGWWLWIIVLFWLWGGRGFGNGFGNGGENCANGLPAQWLLQQRERSYLIFSLTFGRYRSLIYW